METERFHYFRQSIWWMIYPTTLHLKMWIHCVQSIANTAKHFWTQFWIWNSVRLSHSGGNFGELKITIMATNVKRRSTWANTNFSICCNVKLFKNLFERYKFRSDERASTKPITEWTNNFFIETFIGWLQFLSKYGRCTYSGRFAANSKRIDASNPKFRQKFGELVDFRNDWMPRKNRTNQIVCSFCIQSNTPSLHISKSLGASSSCCSSK